MKKSMKIFLGTIASLALIGLILNIVFNSLQHAANREYSISTERFDKKLDDLASSYGASGMSENTKNLIIDFISMIPLEVRDKNNVIVTDQFGNIVYQLDSDYITGDSKKINIAWGNQYAVMTDEKTGVNSWLSIRNMGGYRPPYDGSDAFKQIGNVKYNVGLNELLTAYERQYPQDTDKQVSIFQTGANDAVQYLFWFRDGLVDSALDESLQGNVNSIDYYSYISAGTCLIIIYWLLLPIWVFLDARRRQTQPLPWALLVLLTNVVGLIVYWIVQSQNGKAQPASACPACGKAVKKGYPYCPWCASALVKACKQCGKPLEPGWIACPWCGKKID